MTDHEDRKSGTAEEPADVDAARRAALAKMGRLAGYTAPAMLTLLGATRARAGAACSGGGPGGPGNGASCASWERRIAGLKVGDGGLEQSRPPLVLLACRRKLVFDDRERRPA
jgi:hypothetical protein